MRILISRISDGTRGGAEVSAYDQAIVLNKLGHTVLYVSNMPDLKKRAEKLSIKTDALPWIQIGRPPLRYFLFWLLLPWFGLKALLLIKKFKPDLINPHSREDQLVFTLTKFLHRKPVIWKDAGDLRYFLLQKRQNPFGIIYERLFRYACKKADHIYVLNEDDAYHIHNVLGSPLKNRLTVIPSSILFDDYVIDADPQPRPKDKLVVGYAGRLSRVKQLEKLLEAAKTLDENNVEFWFYGDGDDKKSLQKLASDQSNIKFYGFTDELSSYLNSFDVFVQPSPREGWGRNVKEAMYFGLPVIGPDTGGVAMQIKNGETGMLFKAGDATDLAAKVRLLIEDEALRKKIGLAASNKARKDGDFTKIVEGQILPIYTQFVQPRKTVLIDATPLAKRKLDGIGRYSQSLLAKFEELYGEEYDFKKVGFIDDNYPLDQKILMPRKIFNVLFKLFDLDVTAKEDIGLYPNFVIFPVRAKKSAVVVHDLAFVDRPSEVSPKNKEYLEKFVPKSIQKAEVVITISEFTRQRICDVYKVPKNKVGVVTCGVDAHKFSAANGIDGIRAKYSLPDKFLLFFGSIEPRKNLFGVLEAYSILDKKISNEYGLVLAGGGGWLNKDIMQKVDELRASGNNIVLPGYIADEDLPSLYKSSTALLFPSFYEGFGLPILEAQASGTPVITSNLPPMKDVAGKGAVLADPNEPQAIANAVFDILSSKSLKSRIVKEGYKNIENYTWDKSAGQLKSVLDRL